MDSFKLLGRTVAVLAALAMQPAWSGDIASIAENCDGCHGPGGVSNNTKLPTIAGISELVQSDALFAYLDEARICRPTDFVHGDSSRPNSNMCEVVKAISEDDIDAISAYYGKKPFVPAKQKFDAALAAKGKAIHDESCEKCHSEGGSIAEDDASILAGQWMSYMREAFKEFGSGDREQPKSMKVKMDPLTDEDVEALLHYYASQQ